MRFERDEIHDELYDRFRRLGEELPSGDLTERDMAGEFARADWKSLAENGVQGLILPAEYGGGGHDSVAYVSAMEGLGHGCLDNGLMMSMSAHILAVEVPLWEFGDEEQRRTYLPGLASGALIGANAMSEPGNGSDALALSTIAERDGDGYRLTGHKRYVTNAPVADVFIVYATIDPELSFTGVTAFLVERGDEGVSVRTGSEKMGLRTAPWGEVELDGCRVHASRRLGAEKQGSAIFARTMAWERALIVAPWLGVMRREIDACVLFSRRRRSFGKHIGHFQSVSNRLVDMRTRYELARLLTYRAAAGLDSAEPEYFPEMNKMYTSEAAVEVLQQAMQVYGALGYTRGQDTERNLRDALGGTISSGTSDLQRVVIAGRLGLAWPEQR